MLTFQVGSDERPQRTLIADEILFSNAMGGRTAIGRDANNRRRRTTARAVNGIDHVLNRAHEALAALQDWSTVNLNRDEKQAFAEAAHVLRFGDADGEVTTAIKPEQLLIPRRYDDRADDLWTTSNVGTGAFASTWPTGDTIQPTRHPAIQRESGLP